MTLCVIVTLVVMAPSVSIEASIGESPKSKPGWVYVTKDVKVTLHAVLRGGELAKSKWFRVTPTIGAVDNTTPSFHFEPIPFDEVEIEACRDQSTCSGDQPALGTMAFKVEVTTKAGATISTPGKESTKYGGLTKDVFRVTKRRDDSLLGFATELFNTPYIFGSAGPDGRNQSDLLIGSDCADLIVYARRRQGKKAVYASSYDIDRQAPPIKAGTKAKVGDLVHFPNSRHVALLYDDREPLGEVTEDDLILHTCWAPPTIQRIGDVTQCTSLPYRVLRFPE